MKCERVAGGDDGGGGGGFGGWGVVSDEEVYGCLHAVQMIVIHGQSDHHCLLHLPSETIRKLKRRQACPRHVAKAHDRLVQ